MKCDTPANVHVSGGGAAAAGMSVPRLLAECTGVMDMLEDLDSYETVDMLQVAEHTPRSLVAVLVRVLGDIEVLEALGLEEGANIRCVVCVWRCGDLASSQGLRGWVSCRVVSGLVGLRR